MYAEIIHPLNKPDIRNNENSLVVLIDVLRASSTILSILSNGAKSIITVKTIKETIQYRNNQDFLIAGERNGIRVQGFDFGNSPLEFINNKKIVNKHIVLTTSNFSKAAAKFQQFKNIIIASSLNYESVINWILSNDYKRILIIPAGKAGAPSLEDDYIANYIKQSVLSENIVKISEKDLLKSLIASNHGQHLIKLGRMADIKYISKISILDIVPKRTKNEKIFEIA